MILDKETLSNTLNSSFVLLVGSAISGVSSPHVPRALRIMKGILSRAAEVLAEGSSDDRLLAQYASSLCEGSHLPILRTTKFEEFLWQIETTAGRDALDDLLTSVYVCHDGELGPNQSALAWLLEKRVCIACLTTNFDNSIELASPTLSVYNHPSYPMSLPGSNDPPVLLKLHGDAKARNCVATARAMSDAKRLASHSVLRDLLAGQTVFVLGYSGTGDVDISPHLGAAEANLIWGVRGIDSVVPPFVVHRAVCDLSVADEKKNILLALARLHGWHGQSGGQDHEWTQPLARWCNSIDSRTLSRIVVLTLFGQTGWPVVHVSQFTSVQIAHEDPLIDEGIACLQVSAYKSAETIFRRAISSGRLTENHFITAMVYLGFIQWRRGNLDEALNILWWFYDTSFKAHSKEEFVEIGNGLRIYLEAARDWMQLRRSLTERRGFYLSRRLDDVVKRLKSLPTVDFKGDILAKIVILHIYHLNGHAVELVEARKLFDESFDIMNWPLAETAGRLLVSLSFWDGLSALMKVDGQLIRRGQWNTVRKSVAAMLHALFRDRLPIILSVLDGPIFARIAIPWREWHYKKQLGLWKNRHRHETMDTGPMIMHRTAILQFSVVIAISCALVMIVALIIRRLRTDRAGLHQEKSHT